MSITSTQTTTANLDAPQIRELSPGFGVEVQGLQFAPRVTEENFKLIQDLVTKYGVVVLRKTGLTDETHIALARMFGELDDVKPYNKAGRANRLKYDELFDVGNMEADGSLVDPASPRAQANRGNSFFHVDSSFNPRRAGYSLLLSHELPPPGVGGNTEFCDTRAAWNDLDDDLKKKLLEKNYVACHSILHSKKLAAPEHFANIEPADYPMGRHRLVQKHERSGRMNLYLAMHIHHIEGLGAEESKELFEKLFEHATKDKYRVMVEWKDVGDLVIWDNTATMHRAVGGEFAYKYRRDMRRATVHDDSSQAWGLNEQTDLSRCLIWMFTYIADRQISVRLGQSFWSRGPSLSSNFTATDFPTLQSSSDTTFEDYASVLQANLELTQILHNAHAILYSSTERTLSMIHEGDYPRYLDDFMESATHWDSRWKVLKASPNLRAALRLLYEYVCLYINAFSFHAVVKRKLRPRASEGQRNTAKRCLTSFFPEGITSSSDARYIIGATSAARRLLGVINEQDPKHTLRYLPSRYHLYGLYAAVFLHKALDADAIQGTTQKEEVASLARRFIAALKEVSSAESHICHGYSDLLEKLWSSKGSKRAAAQHDKISSVMPVADTSPEAALQEPPHSGADSVDISGCEDRMPASSLSDLAGLEGGTPDFTSFESYLFGSLWPELASVGHIGEQGGLDQDVQFGFNFDSVL